MHAHMHGGGVPGHFYIQHIKCVPSVPQENYDSCMSWYSICVLMGDYLISHLCAPHISWSGRLVNLIINNFVWLLLEAFFLNQNLCLKISFQKNKPRRKLTHSFFLNVTQKQAVLKKKKARHFKTRAGYTSKILQMFAKKKIKATEKSSLQYFSYRLENN